MHVREEKGRPTEDWGNIMEALLHGTPDAKPVAFAKLNRLISGFLVNLRAFDYREEWEDLRQIVLMKLVQSFSQGKLREPKAFVEYARIVTRHEFYDFLRAHQDMEVTSDPPDLGDTESRDETTTLSVRSALQSLPDKQQQVVQAVYVEGRTYEEAALLTAIPLGSLKRYLQQALTQLRKQLFEVE
jgi:RNA polymerase sigma-70 factor (ECF subfamily)